MKTLTQEQIQKFHRIVWSRILENYKDAQKNKLRIEIADIKASVLSDLGIDSGLMENDCLCCEVAVDCWGCPLVIEGFCEEYEQITYYDIPTEIDISLIENILNAGIEEINCVYTISDELYKLVMEVI